eukprot:Rmarinus@m.1675
MSSRFKKALWDVVEKGKERVGVGRRESMDESGTVEVFITRALTKLVKQAGTNRKNAPIREACEKAIDIVSSAGEGTPITLTSSGNEVPKTPAQTQLDALTRYEGYIKPFILGCQSHNVKFAETSLDCLQKLLLYGYICGNSVVTNKEKEDVLEDNHPMIDTVIDTICSCAEFQEETVQLQVIKALLTAVTGAESEVHDTSLLISVRTMYQLYLRNRNAPQLQATARATLLQTVNVVFQRMAQWQVEAVGVQKPTQATVEDEGGLLGQTGSALDDPVERRSDESALEETVLAVVQSMVDRVDERVLPDDGNGHAEKGERTSASVPSSGSGLSPAVGDDFTNSAIPASSETFHNVVQRDAYLLLRQLCRHSAKTLPEGLPPESVALRKKLLFLELLQSILQTSGHAFRNSEKFIYAIRQYLCHSLLYNCVSVYDEVFAISLNIFEYLLHNFQDHLKNEIGVFFNNIFFRFLESPTSTYYQKSLILKIVLRMCQDPQLLVDFFINYDCDLESLNIFERTVNDLSKIAQGVAGDPALARISPEGVASLQRESLQCTNAILSSLVEWSKKLECVAEQASIAVPTAGLTQKITEKANDQEKISFDEERDHFPTNHTVTASPIAGRSRRSTVLETLSSLQVESDIFNKQKSAKTEMAQIVHKFNMKPRKGLKLLFESGRVPKEPSEVARWLTTTEGLTKTAIGEILGGEEPFEKSVLYALTDAMDFSSMDFDEAVRHFLQSFRLPGEAQKIDRIMEKFAERFHSCNPEMFASADTAYVLAYSVIMLNTDAHNPMVRKKMTCEEFIRSLRGIDDGGDIGEDYLVDLYYRIVNNEIKLMDDDAPSSNKNALLDSKSRAMLLRSEREAVVEKARALFKEKCRTRGVYYRATNVAHVRPMFEVAWCPILAAFSLILEHSESDSVVAYVLEGFKNAIHICSVFYMDLERDAFVSSLSKFTLLHSTGEMKQKNIECIKTMIQIGYAEGNHLEDSWAQILRCVSQLDRLHLIATGAPQDASYFVSEPSDGDGRKRKRSGRPSGTPATAAVTGVVSGLPVEVAAQISSVDEVNSQSVFRTVDQGVINMLFENSVNLDGDAIIAFVKHLCAVSMEMELQTPTNPRVYSMQKIVEIAYYNMDRIRLVWSKIWAHLASYFAKVGCHSNLSISMFAIDSLRQLAMKFLERDELANYQFQKEFLRPFVAIMTHSTAVEIRELIVRCLSQMIAARVDNIKSGWKSVFMVFASAAEDENESIVTLAFEVLEKTVTLYFSLVTETFVDCLCTLVAFASNKLSATISIRAVDALQQCALHLAEGRVCSLSDTPQPAPSAAPSPSAVFSLGSYEDSCDAACPSPHGAASSQGASGARPKAMFSSKNRLHVRLWLPILGGLSRVVADDRVTVRTRALDALFEILNDHGELFTPGMWRVVMRHALFTLFDKSGVRFGPSAGGSGRLVRRHSATHSERSAFDTPEPPARLASVSSRADDGIADDSGAGDESWWGAYLTSNNSMPYNGIGSASSTPLPGTSSAESLNKTVAPTEADPEWLQTTCFTALRALVSLFAAHYHEIGFMLSEMIELLRAFVIHRTETVARIGVSAFSLLVDSCAASFDEETWTEVCDALGTLFTETQPDDLFHPLLCAPAGNQDAHGEKTGTFPLEAAATDDDVPVMDSDQFFGADGSGPNGASGRTTQGPGEDPQHSGSGSGRGTDSNQCGGAQSETASGATEGTAQPGSECGGGDSADNTPNKGDGDSGETSAKVWDRDSLVSEASHGEGGSPAAVQAAPGPDRDSGAAATAGDGVSVSVSVPESTAVGGPGAVDSAGATSDNAGASNQSVEASPLGKERVPQCDGAGTSVRVRAGSDPDHQGKDSFSKDRHAKNEATGSRPSTPPTPTHVPHSRHADTLSAGAQNIDSLPVVAKLGIQFSDVRCKCVVQLLLVQAANELVASHMLQMGVNNVVQIAGRLQDAYAFARAFNSDVQLRTALWRAGFMSHVPNLLKQETHGLSCYVRILFRMFAVPYVETNLSGADAWEQAAEPLLLSMMESIFERYLSCLDSTSPEVMKEMAALTPIVVMVLRGFLAFEEPQMKKHLLLFYVSLSAFWRAESREVREVLCDVFHYRVGALLGIPDIEPLPDEKKRPVL